MRLPDRLALGRTAQQRQRGIGDVVERKKDCCRQTVLKAEAVEQPRHQKADRQGPDIPQEKAGHRAIEGCKADQRTEEGRGHEGRQRR